MLPVVELFRSIQGEGPSMGRPCVFLRTEGCTLSCSFCDTKYAKKALFKWPVDQVVEKVTSELAGMRCRPRLVITGGEPFLHAEELSQVVSRVQEDYSIPVYVEVETNGTLFSWDLLKVASQLNVSLKLSNSGNGLKYRITEQTRELVKALKTANKYSAYKFVVGKEEDVVEAMSLISELDISLKDVWLMPKGSEQAELSRNRQWLFPATIAFGVNYSDRLHVAACGSKRGV